MAGAIGSVTLRGFFNEDDLFTVVLASGIVAADVGKAVAQDTGAANKVKLAGDGDVIVGRLEVVEDRTQEGVLLGTVNFATGFMEIPMKTGETPAVGNLIEGSDSTGKGQVDNTNGKWRVYEVLSSGNVVVRKA